MHHLYRCLILFCLSIAQMAFAAEKPVGIVITNYDPYLPTYPYTYPSPYPYYHGTPTQPFALVPLTVISNLPNAHWRLYHYGQEVYSGMGTMRNIPIPIGNNYFVYPERMEDYRVIVTPHGSFDLLTGAPFKVEIYYQKQLGFLDFEADLPTGESMTVRIVSEEGIKPPMQKTLVSAGGRVVWRAVPLSVGVYTISYELPSRYLPLPSQRVEIMNAQHVAVNPQFFKAGTLQVKTNSTEAAFTLRNDRSGEELQGHGNSFLFKDLPPGRYTLTFTTANQQLYHPPPPQHVSIAPSQKAETSVNYLMNGKVVISSNVDNFSVLIRPVADHKNFNETIFNRTKTIWLPEGVYEITFLPLDGKSSRRQNLNPPASVTVAVRPYYSQSVYQEYKEGSKEDVDEDVTQPESKEQQPKPVIESEQALKGVFVNVPAGKAILGDPFQDKLQNGSASREVKISAFSISAYEVTNDDFAAWLTEAFASGSIKWHPNKPGYLIDREGHLLGRTFEGNPLSQIISQKTSDRISFVPVPGKGFYPVIEVTWFGANAYCKAKGYRLPTEGEWEKAAGMALPATGKPLKRFRYGFGQDEIDPSWANYKVSDTPIAADQVLTTPVGFYNGSHILPLSVGSTSSVTTHDAKSPVGAYDMSGNVWEWVADWYAEDRWAGAAGQDPKGPPSGTQKVAKGGCYDSLADGVRVSERLPLDPEYSDIYTGFRVVK